MKLSHLGWGLAAIVAMVFTGGIAAAQSISLNFSENASNQHFTGGQLIGPLLTDSANWNNTNDYGGALPAGTMTGLKDETGAATAASVTWSSSNAWWNADGTGDDEHKMAVGYLDDGGSGVSVTFSNIPYTNYRVYGLLASDQGNTYNTLDFTVNGTEVFGAATTAPAFGNITTSLSTTGSLWSLADGSSRGNYWTADTSGASLTITGFPRNGTNRGSLTAVIIRDLSVPIFDNTLKATVSRETGVVTITNNTGATVNLAGMGLLSTDGVWASSNWTSITTTYDQGGAVSADKWLELSRSVYDLSEATLGTGALAQGQTISLGAIWQPYFKEASDLRFEYLDATTGESLAGLLEFTGNNGNTLAIGDFNGDGELDAQDWPIVRDNYNSSHTGLSVAQSYHQGDMNGDALTNLNDLLLFKSAFDAANGVGAFAAMVAAVPEPGSIALLTFGGVLLSFRGLRRRVGKASLTLMLGLLLTVTSTASAQTGIGVSFRGGSGTDDTDPSTSGANVTGNAGAVFVQGNWNNVGGNDPATDHNATVTGLLNSAGANSGASITWSTGETWASTSNGQAGVADQDRNLMDGYIDAISAQPTATATFNNIPYTAYDVYVYVGSDGDGRSGKVQINGSVTSDRWFLTSTSTTAFTSAANYLPASALTQGTAAAGNYVVYQDVIGSDLLVGVTRGPINVGMHGVQIVQEADPQVLKLEVNTTTGITRIRNNTAAPINLDYFEISSASAALDKAGWTPLGTGTTNGSNWEVLGNLSDSLLAQFFLDGQGTLAAGASLSLGGAYDGAAQDLKFRYNDPNSFTRYGLVTYVTGGGQDGDFNGDGKVDGRDFLVWQRGGSPNPLSSGDLALWKSNYGVGALTGAVTAVPEPSSLAILGAAIGLATVTFRSRKRIPDNTLPRSSSQSLMALTAVAVTLGLSSLATAAVTNDRDYRLGEGAGENGVAGAIVGSGHSIPNAGDTLDEIGPSGAYLDLFESGSPVYLNVATGAKARPGAGAGALGVQFDGVDDFLSGVPLNRPDELATLLAPAVYPHNYTGIKEHGLQGWVYPDQAGITAGKFQSIVFDTILSGGPAINAEGKWTQINSQHADGTDGIASVPGTVSVTGNQWYHVMHHNYPRGGDNFRSVLYVNGIAVSATDDGIPTGGVTNFTGKLVVGAAEIAGDGISPAYSNYFTGAVDNLEMYVAGDNTAQGGQNWGTFDLFADNDWIASKIAATVPGGILKPGDVNRDGSVNGNGTGPVASDDVSAFIAGWRDRKVLQGAHNTVTAGDWETWGWGDMDHDGVVGFSDWYILRANHEDPGSLNFASILGAVPEPSSVLLLGMSLLGAGFAQRRDRTRQ